MELSRYVLKATQEKTMTVYFSNAGNLDLDVIRTMGVSVKDTETPIGYFGTGLKYAIAVFLREGCELTMHTDGVSYRFWSKTKEIRGKSFDMVMMNEEQLGFTTDLGLNWKLWQAYRELYSNCLDEGGTISTTFADNDTIFSVNGPGITDVHADRGKIFLHGEPWIIGDGVEIHRGVSSYVYYRGVRVQSLPEPSRFTYNLTTHMNLTEDRTLASVFDMMYKLSCRLPKIPNPEFAMKIVDPTREQYEHRFDFSDCYEPSEEFLDAVEKYREHANLRETSRDVLRKKRAVNDHVLFTPDDRQMSMLESACEMLKTLNCYIKPQDLTFVEHLGPGIYAQAKDGKMILTRQCLANGHDFTAITIYEEWIHDKMGYADESRGMQQFLFDKILELLKRG